MSTVSGVTIWTSLAKAWRDYLANAPRPAAPAHEMTGTELLADLEELEAALPVIKAWVEAHPGVITAVDDLLILLEAEGFLWAAKVRAGVDSAPGALPGAETLLRRVIGFLSITQRAPRGGPPITEGDWSRGPQPVDNPSGAIGGPRS